MRESTKLIREKEWVEIKQLLQKVPGLSESAPENLGMEKTRIIPS